MLAGLQRRWVVAFVEQIEGGAEMKVGEARRRQRDHCVGLGDTTQFGEGGLSLGIGFETGDL